MSGAYPQGHNASMSSNTTETWTNVHEPLAMIPEAEFEASAETSRDADFEDTVARLRWAVPMDVVASAESSHSGWADPGYDSDSVHSDDGDSEMEVDDEGQSDVEMDFVDPYWYADYDDDGDDEEEEDRHGVWVSQNPRFVYDIVRSFLGEQARLPDEQREDAGACNICLVPYARVNIDESDADEVAAFEAAVHQEVVVLPCSREGARPHAYHEGCVKEWLMESNSCPDCRTGFTEPPICDDEEEGWNPDDESFVDDDEDEGEDESERLVDPQVADHLAQGQGEQVDSERVRQAQVDSQLVDNEEGPALELMREVLAEHNLRVPAWAQTDEAAGVRMMMAHLERSQARAREMQTQRFFDFQARIYDYRSQGGYLGLREIERQDEDLGATHPAWANRTEESEGNHRWHSMRGGATEAMADMRVYSRRVCS